MNDEVARLDGFLSGLAAVSGSIRDYTAFSYLIDVVGGDSYVEESIKNHFQWYPSLHISHARKLERGIYGLEVEIREFLVSEGAFVSENANDLRKFLSYRVMEMIENVVGDEHVYEVVRADAAAMEFCSEAVYFCIRFGDKMLVMQFNDDKEFKKRP